MKKLFHTLLNTLMKNPAIAYQIRLACNGTYWDASYPRGHFYSPLPDLVEVEKNRDRLLQNIMDINDGVELNEETQKNYFSVISELAKTFPFPKDRVPKFRFFLNNVAFSGLDSVVLYSFLMHFSPKNIIEVGSGFSSCLILDTNEYYFNKSIALTFIEPYPERLEKLLPKNEFNSLNLLQSRVQDLPCDIFGTLEDRDILFIDSSHVSKFGSDVNFLLFKVLPKLKPGVIVHIHDIFWPFEYPTEWTLAGQAWNEAYLIRAFLQFNSAFEILFFNSYFSCHFREEIELALPTCFREAAPTYPQSEHAKRGGSLWLRVASM